METHAVIRSLQRVLVHPERGHITLSDIIRPLHDAPVRTLRYHRKLLVKWRSLPPWIGSIGHFMSSQIEDDFVLAGLEPEWDKQIAEIWDSKTSLSGTFIGVYDG